MASDPPESPELEGPDEGSEGKASRLKRLMLRGSLFEMGAYGLAQVLRLGSNLVLTRLLVPEMFGLMTTVATINTGLVLLSDVGIEQSVIQSENGDKDDFLDTAWTLSVIRGVLLYGLALLIAFPLAYLENEPVFRWLIPLASMNVLLGGFGSMREFLARRNLNLGRLMMLELVSQMISVATMITWASFDPSIAALAAGLFVREVVRVSGTYLLPGTHRPRFRLVPEHQKAIVEFGRWILGSSSVFFFASYTDRLVLLPIVGAAALGVYSIAVLLSEAAFTVVGKVVHGVLFPVFSRVREEGPDRLREVYYEARLRLDVVSMGGIGALFMLGPLIIHLLWDDRYVEAGWMLQVLCVRAALRGLAMCAETCLMSVGETRIGFASNATRAVLLFVLIPTGWYIGGIVGVVWGIALADAPCLLVLWPALRRIGVLRPARELISLGYLAAGATIGFVLDFAIRYVFAL